MTTDVFGLFGASDDRTLGAVESTDDTAGDGDEEHRNNRLTGRMLVEIAPEILEVEFVKNLIGALYKLRENKRKAGFASC